MNEFLLFSKALQALDRVENRYLPDEMVSLHHYSIENGQRFKTEELDRETRQKLFELAREHGDIWLPYQHLCILQSRGDTSVIISACQSDDGRIIFSGMVSFDFGRNWTCTALASAGKWSEGYGFPIKIHNTKWTHERLGQCLTQEQEDEELGDAGSILSEIISLCGLLQLKNIRPKEVNPPGAKTRKAMGKKPLYSYHVLTIDGGSESKGHPDGESSCFYRSHLRRGHIRNLGERKIWVRPTYVSGRIPGFVDKDYNVIASGNSTLH